MEEYLIVSDNTTGELFIMRKASSGVKANPIFVLKG